MTKIAVEIGLKIPDNTAYTALVALRRLGVPVEAVERSDVFIFEDAEAAGDPQALRLKIESDETIFNPNKHRLSVLEHCRPRRGEVWIEPLEADRDSSGAVAWRLLDSNGAPVSRAVAETAAERLLCNPAIERSRFSAE